MIHGDTALWLRVLRYEPLAFDDLVARATALSVTKRGWKSYLKVFLDKRVSARLNGGGRATIGLG